MRRMRRAVRLSALIALSLALAVADQSPTLDSLAQASLATIDGTVTLPGLRDEVSVIRDEWGVPHIYARTTDDLFFAQGYVMAQDRLWQMEMWRRGAEGRLAEIVGRAAVERDRLARLLKYRGAIDDRELTAYHPEAKRLMTAYVGGINAFISANQRRLPVEFVLTGITPEPWRLETLLHRQISFGDATSELQLARSIAELGAAEANRRRNPDPWDDLRIPEGLDVAQVAASHDAMTAAIRAGGPVTPSIAPDYRSLIGPGPSDDGGGIREPGSNNWVVSGALSTTGKPVVANDPHREVTLPSLRYIVHLNAPGWNVIGASEPPFIGVAIGHNERIAWGLTIVGTDQHDVYVEELNPSNHDQVRWNDGWEPVRILREEIRVKGGEPQQIELRFTRHGPIFYEDPGNHRAYALRSALHEPGTAPYLAGLRLAETSNCREFLEAAMFWHAPSENLICGDVDGNIAWQASALTPRRRGWSGRLPVPGDGRYDWDGFRQDLPRELNPQRGFIVTANHNVQPKGYSPPLMFKNADTRFARITRLQQLIVRNRRYSLGDHQRIQNDARSLRAAADIQAFAGWAAKRQDVERARALLAAWDAVYTKDSAAGALYETWRDIVDLGGRGQGRAAAAIDRNALESSLLQAVDRLTKSQGTDWRNWRWGRMHTRAFAHPFVPAFNLAAVERSGGAGTVAADGASFREILDVADWDRSIVTNVPGQSGQPGSPYYGNLLPLWADNRYFPLVFSRKAVDGNAAHTLKLRPPQGPSAAGLNERN
jgi:penicillin amidase